MERGLQRVAAQRAAKDISLTEARWQRVAESIVPRKANAAAEAVVAQWIVWQRPEIAESLLWRVGPLVNLATKVLSNVMRADAKLGLRERGPWRAARGDESRTRTPATRIAAGGPLFLTGHRRAVADDLIIQKWSLTFTLCVPYYYSGNTGSGTFLH